MAPEVRVITNQVLILGLDGLYRGAMTRHESKELLACARVVAKRLRVKPRAVPVEGYYSDTPELREYFLLVRALQECPERKRRRVRDLPEFMRLEAVTSSTLFGRPCPEPLEKKLLPRLCDSLYFALRSYRPSEFTIEALASAAREIALSTDDVSLVGLAAFIGDAALIAALRETSVLYAEWGLPIGIFRKPEIVYEWEVDDALARRAEQFVNEFNTLLGDSVPLPLPTNAGRFWDSAERNKVHGRCVRVAGDPRFDLNYHWGVYRTRDGRYHVEDFWDKRVWTTSYYSGHQVFPVHR
jgi:hypothetical protein